MTDFKISLTNGKAVKINAIFPAVTVWEDNAVSPQSLQISAAREVKKQIPRHFIKQDKCSDFTANKVASRSRSEKTDDNPTKKESKIKIQPPKETKAA